MSCTLRAIIFTIKPPSRILGLGLVLGLGVETGVSLNTDNPSNISVLNAKLSDSTYTITCRDIDNATASDSVAIYVEGETQHVPS